MEFILIDNKKFQITNICIRCILFIFDIFCLIYSYDSIEKNSLFILYCITLIAIFISITNLIRYELIYWKNKDRFFENIEEYILWKKLNLSNIKYLFAAFEYTCKIVILFKIPLMKPENYYYLSIFFIQLNAIFILIILSFLFLYYFYIIFCNPYFFIKTSIYNKIECPICLDKNNKEWITTKCNHNFHKECLNEWIKISNSCPICIVSANYKN
jgi:hypothetical protein